MHPDCGRVLPLHNLATDMTRSIEFRRLIGMSDQMQTRLCGPIAANALPEGPTREAARGALQAAAELGMNQGDLVGILAIRLPGTTIFHCSGSAPGASPDDTTA